MEPRERRLVMILADISGYTKFMVENQLAAVHGQMCITNLIETLLREVDIPLHLQAIRRHADGSHQRLPGNRIYSCGRYGRYGSRLEDRSSGLYADARLSRRRAVSRRRATAGPAGRASRKMNWRRSALSGRRGSGR